MSLQSPSILVIQSQVGGLESSDSSLEEVLIGSGEKSCSYPTLCWYSDSVSLGPENLAGEKTLSKCIRIGLYMGTEFSKDQEPGGL